VKLSPHFQKLKFDLHIFEAAETGSITGFMKIKKAQFRMPGREKLKLLFARA